MADHLSEDLLFQLSEFVADRMGFYFPRERWPDLERGIRSIAREFKFDDPEPCVQWLVSSPVTQSQIETLASYLTVGETYFFRERQSFQVLKDRVLPDLIRGRRGIDNRLRIWSAGCCTGEEPYSIAILLKQALPDIKDWQITILATDINPRFLRKAADGVYSEWSFRGVPPEIKEKYFIKTRNGYFEILPEIKRMVTFCYLNLAEDAYPSLLNNTNAMDVIFCRNVLMYFAGERAKRVISKFHHSLVDGGWLVVSPSETSHILYSRFVVVNFPGAILYQKDTRKASTVVTGGVGASTKPSVQPTPTFSFAPLPELDSPVTQPSKDSMPPDASEQNIAEAERAPYSQALEFYEQGQYEEATRTLSALLAGNSNDSKAMALLARVYANQGKLAEATGWCEKALTADKLNPACHVLHATILQEQGALQKAIQALQRALYLDQNLVLAHFALGIIARWEGKSREATRHFQNAHSVLTAYRKEDVLPASEGMTAGRLMEIIRATTGAEEALENKSASTRA